MNTRKDWLPERDHDLLSWTGTFTGYLFPNIARFGFPSDKYQNLASLRNDFSDKLAIAEATATRTSLTITAKNIAAEALKSALRQDVNQYLTYNPAVTEEDHKGLGIPVHSKERHPAPVAPHAPYILAKAGDLRQVRIDFGESEISRKKPDGQHGVEVASVIADTKPTDTDELIHSLFDTRTPLILTFKEAERGKTLWYAARWENTRGEKGIWSEIMSVVIP
jgi:hypothetical protein